MEAGKWLLLVRNVATLGALLGAVLLESLCESAAGQYLEARLWEALASRGLLGARERTEPASPAPTLAELELGKAPESDDLDFDDIEEGSDESDEESDDGEEGEEGEEESEGEGDEE